ncbi:MAG: hypothetical protein ACK495_31835, partial [Bradyrhizobium sp.]
AIGARYALAGAHRGLSRLPLGLQPRRHRHVFGLQLHAGYLDKDFAALLETVALAAGVKLQPENVPMPTGLETEG